MKNLEKIIELIRIYISKKLSSRFAILFVVSGLGALAPTWWHGIGNWLTLQVTNTPMEPFKDSPVLGTILLVLAFIFFAINFWEVRNTKNKEFIVIRHKSMGDIPLEAIKSGLSFFEKQWDYRELSIDHSDSYNNGVLSNHDSILRNLENVPHRLSGLLETNNDTAIGYYGISHIPLSFYLGFLLSGNKQHIKLFELKNSTNEWNQLDGDISPLNLKTNINELTPSSIPGDIVITIGISFPILSTEIDELKLNNIIKTVTIQPEFPKREILTSYENIEQICSAFVEALETIKNLYPNKKKVHLFYCGPVSLCFALGRKLSERIDSEVQIYNYSNKEVPKYSWCLSMNSKKEASIITAQTKEGEAVATI